MSQAERTSRTEERHEHEAAEQEEAAEHDNQVGFSSKGDKPGAGGEFGQRGETASEMVYGGAGLGKAPAKGLKAKKKPKPVKRVEPGEQQAAIVMGDVVARLVGGREFSLPQGTYVEVAEVEGAQARCMVYGAVAKVFGGDPAIEAWIPVVSLHQQPALSARSKGAEVIDKVIYEQFEGILWGDEGPKANDIDQGRVNSCYILSSAGALARKNKGELIRDVFPGSHAKGQHSYKVRLYQRDGDGKLVPKTITVDTFFPSRPNPEMGGASPIYAGNKIQGGRPITENRDDVPLWPLLLEKAFASLDTAATGGYQSIDTGGTAQSAMEMLTGEKTTGEIVETSYKDSDSPEAAYDRLRELNQKGGVVCNTRSTYKSKPKRDELKLKKWHFYTFAGFSGDSKTHDKKTSLLKFTDPMGSHHPKPMSKEDFVEVFETIQAVGEGKANTRGAGNGGAGMTGDGGAGMTGDGGAGMTGDGGAGMTGDGGAGMTGDGGAGMTGDGGGGKIGNGG